MQKFEPIPLQKSPARIETQMGALVETVQSEESQEIMKKVAVHGEVYGGKVLTPDKLNSENLFPQYKIDIENTRMWASAPYDLGGGRVAVVLYVEKQGKIVARSFYRSNSQALWRYLPNYGPEWYGK